MDLRTRLVNAILSNHSHEGRVLEMLGFVKDYLKGEIEKMEKLEKEEELENRKEYGNLIEAKFLVESDIKL
jgi:hypothetical protein